VLCDGTVPRGRMREFHQRLDAFSLMPGSFRVVDIRSPHAPAKELSIPSFAAGRHRKSRWRSRYLHQYELAAL
jgi:hypothetical protein